MGFELRRRSVLLKYVERPQTVAPDLQERDRATFQSLTNKLPASAVRCYAVAGIYVRISVREREGSVAQLGLVSRPVTHGQVTNVLEEVEVSTVTVAYCKLSF
jgi:hypothetical protein